MAAGVCSLQAAESIRLPVWPWERPLHTWAGVLSVNAAFWGHHPPGSCRSEGPWPCPEHSADTPAPRSGDTPTPRPWRGHQGCLQWGHCCFSTSASCMPQLVFLRQSPVLHVSRLVPVVAVYVLVCAGRASPSFSSATGESQQVVPRVAPCWGLSCSPLHRRSLSQRTWGRGAGLGPGCLMRSRSQLGPPHVTSLPRP